MLFSYLWGNKYLPKKINELYCNYEEIKDIVDLLTDLHNNREGIKNGFIIYNDETSSINLQTIKVILEEKKFSFNEVNFDGNENIKLDVKLESIGERNITDIFNNRKTSILITEQLKKKNLEIIKNYLQSNKQIPVFLFVQKNSKNEKKILQNFCNEFYLSKPTDTDIFNLIKKISKDEKININDPVIIYLVDKCNNDIDRVFLILENLKTYYNNKKITIRNIEESLSVFTSKDIDINSYGFIKNLYSSDIDINECINYYECNQQITYLLHENYYNNLFKKKKDNSLKFRVLNDYYEKMIDSSIIEKYVFNNRKWELNCYVGFLSLKYPNYLISSNDLYISNISLNNASITSKINYLYHNLKYINEIIKKLNISVDNFQNFAFLIYDYFIFNTITEQKAINKLIKYLQKNNITITNFDKIVKLSYLYDTYSKIYTQKKKTSITKLITRTANF